MNTEQILEFHEIKRKLIEFAHTEHAKQKIQELTPYLSQAKAEAALRDTTEGMCLGEPGKAVPSILHNGLECQRDCWNVPKE